MNYPGFTAMMLALESNAVIGLRLMRIARGGVNARDEMILMVREKVEALGEASATLMGGGAIDDVLNRYREHVAVNAWRLLQPVS